jgi:hypothetical protein
MNSKYQAKNLKGKGHDRDTDVERKMLLIWILGNSVRGFLDCVQLTQNKDQWRRAILNNVMDVSVS